MEVGGSGGRPVVPQFKFPLSHAAEDGSIDDVGKTTLVPPKVEKGELLMGPMVMSGWKSKYYSAPTEESIALVGKSTRMTKTTSRDFTPHTTGVGQRSWKPHCNTQAKDN